MARVRMSEQQKLFLLRNIQDRKEELFAPFSNDVTAHLKMERWSEIINKCRNECGFDPTNGKGWQHLRDSTWPNIKNYVIAKRDKFKQSGAEGGHEARVTEADGIVLEIVGRGSPVMDGLKVIDSNSRAPMNYTIEDTEEQETRARQEQEQEQGQHNTRKRKKQRETTEIDEVTHLKKQKLQLQVEELKLRCEHWRLRNAELRRSQGHDNDGRPISPHLTDVLTIACNSSEF